MSTSTITTAKSSFLQSQIRLLSAPLQPPPSWSQSSQSDPSTSTTTDKIPPPKILADLLTKVNTKIKSHNRLVFSPQSSRHVAEQIDALYWDEVVPSFSRDGHGAAAVKERDGEKVVWVKNDIDLSETTALEGLPDHLYDTATATATATERGEEKQEEEYQTLKNKATELAKRRDELRKKLDALRKVRVLLGPFEDATRNVQGGLVTRDGELARELERLRVLVVRVQAGLERGSISSGGDVSETREDKRVVTEQEKLGLILELG